jgi:acyl-CoA thioesterase FadM
MEVNGTEQEDEEDETYWLVVRLETYYNHEWKSGHEVRVTMRIWVLIAQIVYTLL